MFFSFLIIKGHLIEIVGTFIIYNIILNAQFFLTVKTYFL